MALRAGYYGVKRWLWDKLQSVPDKVDGLIESNNITGAKNFINNKDITAKSGATLTYTETGFTSVVSSASWSGAEYNRRCNAKTDFILDLDTDITSGVTYVAVQGSSNGTSYTNIKTSAVLTADGHISIPFNTGDYTYLKIIFYTTNATVTSGNVTISDITLYLASEPDKSYAPYAMTNQELTAAVFKKRNLSSADDLNDITESGIYSATSTPTNTPESRSWYTLIVDAQSDDSIRQMILSGGNAIYLRSKGGSPTAWGAWYKYTGTAVTQAKTPTDDPELSVEEPEVVVKKSTRKSTKKTEEEG